MLERTRQTRTKSMNYFASLREFALQRMGVVLDFAASWCSRATAISSEPSKELRKEVSPMKREATLDLATTRFSFRTDSSRLSELPTEVKNTISHRAKAIRALADRLRGLEFGD